jgi:uncharacterized protein (TIGR02246 family)
MSDEQEIRDLRDLRDLIDRWHRASAAGELEVVAGLMTDDVIFLTPGRPPMDKAAFLQGAQGFAGKMRLESRFEIQEVVVSGDLAICRTHIDLTTTVVASGERAHRAGHTLSVFRRDQGRWRLARDANLMVAGSPV